MRFPNCREILRAQLSRAESRHPFVSRPETFTIRSQISYRRSTLDRLSDCMRRFQGRNNCLRSAPGQWSPSTLNVRSGHDTGPARILEHRMPRPDRGIVHPAETSASMQSVRPYLAVRRSKFLATPREIPSRHSAAASDSSNLDLQSLEDSSWRFASSGPFADGSPGVLQGTYSTYCKIMAGQIALTHSVSAGAGLSSIGPDHASSGFWPRPVRARFGH